MPTRRAIASGNWSSTSTWNGGVVPTNGDTVYSNGFTVTIDQNIDIGGSNNPLVSAGSFVSGQWYEITAVGSTNFTTISATSNTIGGIFLSTGAGSGTGQARALATLTTATNTAAGATSGGGQFNMSAAYNMTCDLRAAATVCLNVTGSTNMNLSGLRIFGGGTIGGNGLSYAGSGTVTVDGCILTGGSSNGASISNASSGNVVVTNSTLTSGVAGVAHAIGNSSIGSVSITNSTITASSTATVTINNASTGSITISNSNLTGGNTNAHAIANVTTGTITASNCTFLGGNTGFAIQNTSSGTVICTGSTFTASAFTNAINIANTSADVRLSGDFFDHWSGWKAVNGQRWRLGTTPTAARTRYALAGTTDSYVEMFTADNTGFGLPAANHVRSGISYGGGLVGTCAVPAAGSVALGVPVGSTTGTAVLTGAAVASAVWDALTSSLTTSGSIGERVKNCSTAEITGEQLAAALSTP